VVIFSVAIAASLFFPGRQEDVPAPAASCTHRDQIRDVKPQSQGCAQCLKKGDAWVQLRMCLTCGNVGCCDSSKNRHATAHYEATGHPVMRSMQPGERWQWCYVDKTRLEGGL